MIANDELSSFNRFLATAFLSALIWISAQPSHAESRVALVLGNSMYERAPALPNPTRDATDIGQSLERLGFKVTHVKNATASEMRKAIVDFGRTTEGAEMAVVFYAGHGMEVAGENWLVPINAELRSDADIESEAISLRSINLQVSKARQLGLIILDACRNNPFSAKMKRSITTRAVTRGLAPTEPSDNVLIAYAARDGTLAADGDGRNSPFTAALLRHIETPGLEISFLFRRVRDDVIAATKREQQPFVYGSLSKEEIYLRPPVAATLGRPIPEPTSSAPSEDDQFWSAIQTSTVIGLFEDYVGKYPKGNHVAEARQRMKALKAKDIASLSPAGTGTTADSVPARSNIMSSEFNLFTAQDAKRVAAIATAQRLNLPKFEITPVSDGPLNKVSKFIGVWSSKNGWNGEGRKAMVIITAISATNLVQGYYVWGPPTKASWTQDAADYKPFSEYAVKDIFSINVTPPITAKFSKNVLTLSTTRLNKSTHKSRIQLRPVWQLANISEDVALDSKRKPSAQQERTSSKKKLSANRATASSRAASPGTTMEDRFRACRKLVTGFARREACARNGTI